MLEANASLRMQRWPPKRQAVASFRPRAARSKGESPGKVIHNVNIECEGNVSG
jgi:hypothetical protein